MDARLFIFTATALGRDRVGSHILGRLYPEKAPLYILQEAEWTPESVWIGRSE